MQPQQLPRNYNRGGVRVTGPIKKGEFVTEYKTYLIYPLSEKSKHEEEYECNNEGSYILEGQLLSRGGVRRVA